MSEFAGKSATHEQEEQKLDTRAEVKRLTGLTIFVIVVTVLAVLVAVAVFAQDKEPPKAQDKYSLKSPSGIAFSDFRGYEDWPAVSSARQDEILKVIVANPKMISAYKAGVPGNGQPFPEGSMIVKLQWKQKKSTEAQFAVDVPDVFTQAFVMEKDSKISENRWLGVRRVQLRCRVGQGHARCQKPFRLRQRLPYGREDEGLHLPPVRDALSDARLEL